ncbi:flagellar filament capping protein FliD [Luteimonas sp. MHLX1A]|uniref:flagellar filament capping protein FliD n=1 Tax=Alterluteimonas muca TaxID=2878684 RepID=UPI001E2D2132|nr:flagellar filament capping protein FliD [Luteimonas sp. MHLX1A]MCD9045739.1 flagellar filament capping protein FliD [Luteimonas sp. MHLX1A]
MAINAVGSGLDIPSLVSSLVSSSRAPTEKRINTAGAAVNAKLSAVGQIRNAMSSLQTALEKLSGSADTPAFKATLPADAGFAATTSSGAMAGSWSVRVDSLATAQKLASAGHAAEAAIGHGTLAFAWGEDSTLEVEIAEGATLSQIAAAVNRAAGGKGVTASVVTTGDGQNPEQRLVFTAAQTGTANALTVTAQGGDGGLSVLTSGGGLTETVTATNARVWVDGLERVSASNSVADLVPGTVLELTRATDAAQTLRIGADNEALGKNLESFVTAYNNVVNALRNTSSYNAATKSASALTGDSLVRTLQSQLRGIAGVEMEGLKALGITSNKEGQLVFNAGDFATAHAAEPGAVVAMFGKDGAYTTAMSQVLKDNLDSISGSLVLRTEGLNKQVAEYEKQLDALDVRMTRLADLYTSQFTAMETMIVQMQSSSSSLNSLLASVNKD